MMHQFKKVFWISSSCLLLIIGVLFLFDALKIGSTVDSYKGVPVYYNGILFFRSHGRHYDQDGYYFGQKWQCVEYIKRFLYTEKRHALPDGFGHAKDFFDPEVSQGGINKRRALVQYHNGGDVKPEPDDILVLTT